MSIEVGSIVEGKVTGITNFGAFVELPDGSVGLVHISEVANVFVKNINDFLKEKDTVKVKVLTVNGNKIGLSIKQLQPKPVKTEALNTRSPHGGQRDAVHFRDNPHRSFNNDFRRQNNTFKSPSFEDKLSKFLKDSDERNTDLRRRTDSKRGGRGSRHYE